MSFWPRFLRIPRAPDVVIGGDDNPYLRRWHVIPRNPWFNVYLHDFRRSDDDRAMHDHPWWNISIVLRGRYIEHILDEPSRICGPGTIVFRPALMAHRIELFNVPARPRPCLTLFITGRRRREWGFYCPRGWVHWQEFLDPSGLTTGKGCD